MRVLKIDAVNRVITEHDEPGSLEDIQGWVGGWIEAAITFPNSDVVYVNEEGLFNDPQHFFHFPMAGTQPFAGNGYVIGADFSSGENKPAETTLDWLKDSVVFLGIDDVKKMYE